MGAGEEMTSKRERRATRGAALWRWCRATCLAVGMGLGFLGVGWAADIGADARGDAGADPGVEAAAAAAGQALAEDLRSRRPPETVSYDGSIELRSASGQRRSVAMRFETRVTPAGWEAVYRTVEAAGGEQLRVIHRREGGLEYRWGRLHDGRVVDEEIVPGGDGRAKRGFGGSDFVAADLGLDFLHWPVQRLVKVKNPMRKGRACKVIESSGVGPEAAYQRVRAWIDLDSGGPIYAEAYDVTGRLIKVFEVDRVTKVEGEWQLTEMKMRNEQADTRSAIRFDPGRK